MEFEWDPVKAEQNLLKHAVSFIEAASVFADLLGISAPDPDHSEEEDRWVTVGVSDTGRQLMVASTERGGRIRIISARLLTRAERDSYESDDFDV